MNLGQAMCKMSAFVINDVSISKKQACSNGQFQEVKKFKVTIKTTIIGWNLKKKKLYLHLILK